MLNNILLPNTVANLYNLATLECITNLSNDGLRLHLNNGRITEAYIIPDNRKEYFILTMAESQKPT